MRLRSGERGSVRACGWVVTLFACLPLSAAVAQNAPEQPQQVLERVRQRITADLERLPNYTCVETLERSVRRHPDRQLFLNDRVRLEVAFIGMNEMFSWPGAARFQFSSVDQMVVGGASGFGSFGGWTHSISRSSSARFNYAGERDINGRRALRFTFEVALLSSAYRIGFRGREVPAPYSGVVWIDPEARRAVRLEIRAEKIDLPIASVAEVIDYAPIRVGAGEFVLPQSSEVTIIDLLGDEYTNAIRFTGCRQYVAESSLSFDAPVASERPSQNRVSEVPLPAGLKLDTRLETPIDFDESAVGDPVTARLRRAVQAGGLTLPKGALLAGRIRRLERLSRPENYFVVGLEFFSLAFGERRAEVRARLIGPELKVEEVKQSPFYGAPPASRGFETTGLDIYASDAPLSFGTFRVSSASLHLKRGLRMIWETQGK